MEKTYVKEEIEEDEGNSLDMKEIKLEQDSSVMDPSNHSVLYESEQCQSPVHEQS